MGLVFIYMLNAIDITCGTCFGAWVVRVSVYTIADYSLISDETGLATEGVCCVGILMYVCTVNVWQLSRNSGRA